MSIRKIRILVSLILSIIGFLLLIPAFFLSPDDILNFLLASALTIYFGFEPIFALLLTYTIIPIALILISVQIYPAKNGYVFKEKIKKPLYHKIGKVFYFFKKNPLFFVIGLIISFIAFQYYLSFLETLV